MGVERLLNRVVFVNLAQISIQSYFKKKHRKHIQNNPYTKLLHKRLKWDEYISK